MAVAKLRSPTKRPVIVTATQPNAGVRAWYAAQLDKLLSEAHLDLALKLGIAWADEPPSLVIKDSALAEDASVSKTQKVLTVWARAWQSRFDKMSQSIAERFAEKSFGMTEQSMRAAFKRAGFTVAFKPTRESMDAYRAVIAENVNLIKSIPAQYLKDVQSQVWASVRVGGDMHTLSVKLAKQYAISTRRAALIARDQNAKATATIENTRRQQLGLKRAIWQHSAAGKEPRPTHVAMDGKPFDLDKGMWDSDENEWVLPGQLINCRCTSRAVIPGFED